MQIRTNLEGDQFFDYEAGNNTVSTAACAESSGAGEMPTAELHTEDAGALRAPRGPALTATYAGLTKGAATAPSGWFLNSLHGGARRGPETPGVCRRETVPWGAGDERGFGAGAISQRKGHPPGRSRKAWAGHCGRR